MLKPHPVGIAWYAREDYARILEFMADADLMPETFDDWLMRASAVEQELQAHGFSVLRAPLWTDAFVKWCHLANRQADAEARCDFAAAFAERMEADHRPIHVNLCIA